MKKAKPTTTHYEASKVIKLPSKKGGVVQFTLTITFDEGCAITMKNCIIGIGKKGPWATAPLDKYKNTRWNQALSDKLIKQFQLAGYLDDIEPRTWAEGEEGTLTWEN